MVSKDLRRFLRIADFERELYAAADLTVEKTLEIAKRVYRKHFDRTDRKSVV